MGLCLMEKHTLTEVFDLCNKLNECNKLRSIKAWPKKEDFHLYEKELGYSFPPSFIEYWIRIKWDIQHMICCIKPSLFNMFDILDIVKANRRIRKEGGGKFPDFLILMDITAAIDDDYYCFDTRKASQEGEYPVVYWSMTEPDYLLDTDSETGLPIEIDDITTVAPDFPSYIYSLLEADIEITV